VKQKIQYLQDVRQFAVDSLKLADTDNYTTYYDQKGQPALWVITACPPFSLEPYEWNYSWLGSMPYKGHFKKELALAEYQELEQEGLDVHFGTVAAWSTLGWFSDPILSGMFRRSEGHLAELIIHELTHATIFVSGDAELNESLATFIGEQGAQRFLAIYFGKHSTEYTRYVNSLADEKLYKLHLMEGAQQLNALYEQFSDDVSEDEKVRLKKEKIRDIFNRAASLDLASPKRYYFLRNRDTIPNNTYFADYLVYNAKTYGFANELHDAFNGDLTAFIAAQRELWE